MELKLIAVAVPRVHRAGASPVLHVAQNLDDFTQPGNRLVIRHPIVALDKVYRAGPLSPR